MLIISKFRDYYDASVGYGIDKSIIYERETKVITSKEFFLDHYIGGDNFHLKSENLNGGKLHNEWKIIGFCGRTYVALIEMKKDNDGQTNIVECFFGEDALNKAYENDKNKKQRYWYKETQEFIYKWHEKEFTNFFIEQKVPIFDVEPLNRYQNANVTLNPSLEKYKFFRIFDSYTAFQEIQMFISGVMGTGSPDTLEISNKEKIKQYGFDVEWSFRNPDPPKRKQK